MKANRNHSFVLLLSVALLCAWSLPGAVQAVGNSEVIASFNMDSDPGWTTQGQWQFGQPQGFGGDPSSGYTGANVYGYNLAGQYPNNMPLYWLTSTPMDCSGYTNVMLTFQRWLGVESASWDHAYVQASNNGSAWQTVWSHVGSSIGGGPWREMNYDISAVADGQETVYIRWGMGTTDGSVTYCGWNIDDVSLTGDILDDLFITPPAAQVVSGYEGGPFAPTNLVFDVQNTGSSPMSWSVGCTNSWLHLSSTGDVFAAGSTGTVLVSLDPDIENWGPATNVASIVFSNENSGVEQSVNVSLQIAERQLSGFSWDHISSNHFFINQPIPVRIQAVNQTGTLFPDYTNSVDLAGFAGGGTQSNTFMLDKSYSASWSGIDRVRGVRFTPTNDISVTHVRRFYGDLVSIWTDDGTLLAEKALSGPSGTWIEAPLDSPLDLTAGQSYRIGAYLSSTAVYYADTSGTPMAFPDGTIDYGCWLNGSYGAPLNDTGGYKYLVDMSYTVGSSLNIQISPTNTGGFVAGVWAGAVTAYEAASNLVLQATAGGGVSGDSNPFTVLPLILSVVLPDELTEGDPDFSVQVLANYSSETDMLIALEVDNTNAIAVPGNVVIPAGQTSVTFSAEVVDDNLLDGTASVTVTASITNYLPGADSMYVHDNETATLAVSLPQTTSEGAGMISGVVIPDATPDVDIVVHLISNNTNEIGHGIAVISAGQNIASFTLPVNDDSAIDGIQTATIEAHVENWQSGYASVFVFDNETTGIDLQLPASLSEGDGVITNGGLLSIPAMAVADINVLLTCSDSSEVVVPGYVTIPAGTNHVVFDVSVVDDMDPERRTRVSILAQAPGYIPDSSSIAIADNDPHHFLVEGLSGDLPASDLVSISVSAQTMDGDLVEIPSEAVSLTANGDRGAVGITPSVLTNVVDGVVTGLVAFGNIGNDVILVATDSGITGTSTVFNVTGSQISISPSSLTNTLVVEGSAATRTMVISNAGNADLEFEIQEVPVYSNLVINGDFESGNFGFTSTFVYTPLTNTQAKGVYTVADNSKTWIGNFVTTMKDHTSEDGNMLMANGTSTGTAVVWQQEIQVAAGVTYDVSAWAASLHGEFLPLLDFQVNGVSLGSITAENLTWKKFFTQWTAISNAAVTFSIIDAQFIPPFLPGNHFAIDDIMFKPASVLVASDQQTEGLIAHYPFNGNANDESGNGHDGTVNGATLTSDRFGNAESAYHFNGVDNYIDLGSMSHFRTVSLWVKQAEHDYYDFYFGHNNFRLYAETRYSGQLWFSDSLRSITTSVHMDDHIDQWVHIVAINDGSNSKVYVNGANVTVSGSLGAISVGSVNLGRSTSGPFYLRGDLDDVRIYDRALSAEEVEALYMERDRASNQFAPRWISSNPESGIIPPGSNIAVTGTFDASGMVAGDHANALLMVTCNDVVSPSNDIAVSMYVITEPVDSDGDGIPAWWEQMYFGGPTNANPLADSDGDGQSDYDEFVAGMNPTNPASYFMINGASVPTNGRFVVYWDSTSGRVYSVHWSPELTNAFTPMATNVFYPQGSYTDEVHQAEDCGFYRIDVELE